MTLRSVNIYERVFESLLCEQKVAFKSVVQTERVGSGTLSVKNFDFVLRPQTAAPVLVELKGRTFHGRSLEGFKGLDAWVTFEDVEALTYWLTLLRQQTPGTRAVLVFVYRLEQADIESDGLPIYSFGDDRFIMLFIELEDYCKGMKCRSPKWQTVMPSAAAFRRHARPIHVLFGADE